MLAIALTEAFLHLRNRRDEAVFKPRLLRLTSPAGLISPSQDCYFINNSYGNEGQGRTRFSHKLDVAMNVSLCLPWPRCGIRHCLLGPEGQTQRKKWKASTFLHGTQRQQEKGREREKKTEWTPSLSLSLFFSPSVIPAFSPSHRFFGSFVLCSNSLHSFFSVINNHTLGFKWQSVHVKKNQKTQPFSFKSVI